MENLSRNADQFYRAATLKFKEACLILEAAQNEDDEEHVYGASYLMGYPVEMGIKAVLAEIEPQYQVVEGDKGKRKLKEDFGHELPNLVRGLQYILTQYKSGEYRELLDLLDPDTNLIRLYEVSKWNVSWRYLDGVEWTDQEMGRETVARKLDLEFSENLKEHVYNIFEELRSILIDIQSRR